MSGDAQDKVQAVLTRLSPSRMRPYLEAAGGRAEALDLYRWDSRLSGELHQALTLVEVVLRNAIDAELRRWNAAQPQTLPEPFDQRWIERPARPLWAILNPPRRSGGRHSAYRTGLTRAEQDIQARNPGHARFGAAVSHDDLVAHMTFGTWVNLLPRRQQDSVVGPARQLRLWDDAIGAAFRSGQSPQVVHYWAARLRDLRNRVAHAESLLDLDVRASHRTIARLLGSIEPQVADWYTANEKLLAVFNQRP